MAGFTLPGTAALQQQAATWGHRRFLFFWLFVGGLIFALLAFSALKGGPFVTNHWNCQDKLVTVVQDLGLTGEHAADGDHPTILNAIYTDKLTLAVIPASDASRAVVLASAVFPGANPCIVTPLKIAKNVLTVQVKLDWTSYFANTLTFAFTYHAGQNPLYTGPQVSE